MKKNMILVLLMLLIISIISGSVDNVPVISTVSASANATQFHETLPTPTATPALLQIQSSIASSTLNSVLTPAQNTENNYTVKDFVLALIGAVFGAVPSFFIGILSKKKLEERKKQKNRKRRMNFNNVLISESFKKWELNLIKILYNNFKPIELYNKEYAVCFVKPSKRVVYPFKEFNNQKNLNVQKPIIGLQKNGLSFKLTKEQSLYYKKYKNIIGEKIKRPKLYGYMLDSILLDNKNRMYGFKAKVGMYEQNIYTTHVIGYELYKNYIKYRENFLKFNKDNIYKKMPIIKEIHCNRSEKEILMKSLPDYYSEFGVIALTLMYCKDENTYKVAFHRRSDEVAAAPQNYQFIPSGGFELLAEDVESGDEHNLYEQFNIEDAVFREFLEEIYDKKQYSATAYPVQPIHNLEFDKLPLLKLINEKKLNFEFLGTIFGFFGTRHELAFAIIIDDPDVYREKVYPSEEADAIGFISLNKLSEFIKSKTLHEVSAALLKLFLESELYKEIIKHKQIQ